MRNTLRSYLPWTPHSRSQYSNRLAFSSALSRLVQDFRCVAGGLALLALASARPCVAVQFSADVYDSVKPSVVRVSCSNRAGTGFLWSNPDTAVTALHVVAGCEKITVYYEALKVTRPARVAKVLRQADLVLLKITDAPSAQVLVVDPKPPSLPDQLSTLGYPLQILSMSSTSLQLRYGGKTLRNIVPDSVAQALSGGSPSLDLEIDTSKGICCRGTLVRPSLMDNVRSSPSPTAVSKTERQRSAGEFPLTSSINLQHPMNIQIQRWQPVHHLPFPSHLTMRPGIWERRHVRARR